MRWPLVGSIGGPGVSSATLKPELPDAGMPYTCPAREPAAKSIHTGSSRTVNRASPGAVPKYSTSWRDVVTAAPATSGNSHGSHGPHAKTNASASSDVPSSSGSRPSAPPSTASGAGSRLGGTRRLLPSDALDHVLAGAPC